MGLIVKLRCVVFLVTVAIFGPACSQKPSKTADAGSGLARPVTADGALPRQATPASADLPAAVTVPVVDPALVGAGRAVYIKYCALCHGVNAEGYAADNAPSLVSRTFLESATDEFLRSSIENGRPGTAMAGYGAAIGGPLGQPQVNALIALLRSRGVPQLAVTRQAAVGDAKRGAGLYGSKCAQCHGTVNQRAQAVHLFNPGLLATASDGFLRHAIDHGRPGTQMAAWSALLSSVQIDEILFYIRVTAPPLPPRPTAYAGSGDGQLLPGAAGDGHALPGAAGDGHALPGAAGDGHALPGAAGDGQALPGAATDVGLAPPMPPTPKPTGPIVIHPKGRPAQFKLRDDRFARIDDVNKALADKRRIIILDARPPSDYAMLHIAGAIVTPYYDKKSLEVVPNDGTWTIAYCACPHHASGEVFEELKRRGYKNVAVLDEGVFAWQAKGYPVVKSASAPVFAAPPPLGTVPE
ncbi:MAG: hypothetical protein EXR77_05775 [Myxococcales bacterium]|nr:hypothetical protein [Myxococcales bacterium]